MAPAGRRRREERISGSRLDEQGRAFQRRQDVTLVDPEDARRRAGFVVPPGRY